MNISCLRCSSKFESDELTKFCSASCQRAHEVEQWRSYAASLQWQKGNLDPASYATFLRAGSLHIPAAEAYREVAERITAAGDHPKEHKLRCQINRAYEYAGAQAVLNGCALPKKKPKPVYQPSKLQRLAKRVDEVSPEWLKQISPVSASICPSGFLHELYGPEEKVLVFDVFESQGCEVWRYGTALDHLREGRQNVWYLANPVDGQYHWNPRQQKRSRRSEESITAWRFAVVESDSAPKNLWLRALVQLPLPIVAIYDSGGSSIHAPIRIDAESKSEWDEIVRCKLGPRLVELGADYGALTAVRLTRLPNCRRGETGNMQALLYLNPQADNTPIKEVAHGR
jgi:hypothetical protein